MMRTRLPPTYSPFSLLEFWQQTREVNSSDYESL
jgi:hypothetical protein